MRLLNTATFLLWLSGAVGIVHASPVENIEKRSLVDPIQHGNYGRSLGKIYRYHEVSDGLFAGVAPEDWDDSVHVRRSWSTEGFDSGQYSPVDESALATRQNGIASACKTGLTCAKATFASTAATLYGLSEQFIDKLKEKGPLVMNTLNQPFWANFAGVGGQNFIVTGIFSQVEKKSDKPPPPEQCSMNNSQEDLLRQLIMFGCSSNPERKAFSQSITLPDGSVFVLNMTAAPGHNLSDSDTCGAPKAP
ncbi:hypothetical protein FDECE_13772 [Fusarium decemcellulare]|nr:hypothetical protein FDECE_13772 [Fusarium decemcellulare]